MHPVNCLSDVAREYLMSVEGMWIALEDVVPESSAAADARRVSCDPSGTLHLCHRRGSSGRKSETSGAVPARARFQIGTGNESDRGRLLRLPQVTRRTLRSGFR